MRRLIFGRAADFMIHPDSNQRSIVLYVMGTAFSGSTLFGLALGQQEGIINLGEITNLENDYAPGIRCSCENTLHNCQFWSKLIPDVSARQKDLANPLQWTFAVEAKRDVIDDRGNYLRKLSTILGRSCSAAFGEKNVARYAARNAEFFRALQDCLPATRAFVDLSKSPERLEALLTRDDLDVRPIFLKRSPMAVFSSLMKRPIRQRTSFGPKAIHNSMFLYLRLRHCERVFAAVNPAKKIVVSFERFIARPIEILDAIVKSLGLSITCAPLEDGQLCMFPKRQHVYVGNRWLFRNCPDKVVVKRRDDISRLTHFQKLALYSVFRTTRLDMNYGPESI